MLLGACTPDRGGPATGDGSGGAGPVDTGPPCGDGERPVGDQCVPEACGEGPWPEGLVDGETVFVHPDGTDDGDGTRARPLRSIQDGLDAAGLRGSGVVALADGTWSETVAFHTALPALELRGRCPALTVLAPPAGDAASVLLVAREAAVRGLRVTGAPSTERMIRVQEGGHLTGVGIEISDVPGSAVLVQAGASLVLEDSLIARTGTEGSTPSAAVYTEDGAITCARCRLEDIRGAGLYVIGDDAVLALDETVLDGLGRVGTFGVGVLVGAGAEASVAGGAFRHVVGNSVQVDGFANATIEGTRFEDLGEEGDLGTTALAATGSARLTLTDVAVTHARGNGLFAHNYGSIQVQGVTLTDVGEAAGLTYAGAVTARDGGFITGGDLAVYGAVGAAIQGLGASAAIVLTGVTVAEVEAALPVSYSDAPAGVAVLARGGRIALEDGAISGATGLAAAAFDDGSIILERLRVDGTRPLADGTAPFDTLATENSRIACYGSTLASPEAWGLWAQGERAEALLQDCVFEASSHAALVVVGARSCSRRGWTSSTAGVSRHSPRSPTPRWSSTSPRFAAPGTPGATSTGRRWSPCGARRSSSRTTSSKARTGPRWPRRAPSSTSRAPRCATTSPPGCCSPEPPPRSTPSRSRTPRVSTRWGATASGPSRSWSRPT